MFQLINNILNSMNYILNTKTKRHIAGGMLLSASLAFGGLALTIMTIKREENVEDEEWN